MNHTLLVKKYLTDNERKINNILRWFPLAFLIMCPALLIASQAGALLFDLSFWIKMCIVIAVLCVFPSVFVHYSYNEMINRCVCLSVIEVFICLIAVIDAFNISLAFVLVPLISTLYLDRSVFVHTARNCFLVMLALKLGVFVYRYQESIKKDIAYEADYMAFVALALEYIIIVVALYFTVQWFEDMVSSGYKLQNRGDGTYTTAAAVIQEQMNEESYNTKGLFLDVGHRVESLIRGKNKKFEMNIDDQLPSQFKGDPERIKLALINILSDFVQFTENGKVTMDVTYEKGITPKKGQNITMVCKIQSSQDLSEDLRYGNALGFALAKNMIQKMDGILLNKSGGSPYLTSYIVSFQQMVDGGETISQMRASHKREQEMLIADSRKKAENLMYVKAGKALIVDDNEMNQKLVAAILKSYGLDSVCVSSGDEAIEVVQSKEFNLVVLDYMMPIKGGLQIAKELRQLGDPYYEELPLIAMTSNNTEESKMMFYDNRFAEVISKPIKEDELRLAIALCMCL
nr:response regulator [Lachnospiraceae bacterium]